jgi:hypothetical protein
MYENSATVATAPPSAVVDPWSKLASGTASAGIWPRRCVLCRHIARSVRSGIRLQPLLGHPYLVVLVLEECTVPVDANETHETQRRRNVDQVRRTLSVSAM